MHTHYNYTWETSTGRHKAEPLKYFEPDNIGDIVRIVKEAERRHVEVRTVGAGHSFNDIAVSEGFLVSLNRMDHLLKLRRDYLREEWQHHNMVHVQAGMTIQEFNRLMDKRGLCVQNMGGIDNQTLAGAMATATHGTGINQPGMQGMVRSVMLVTHEGEVVRIEPSEGVMNPKKYKVAGVRLIQDDRYFNSVLVHLGCFGIICSYILELKDMYYLEESKEVTKWSKIRDKLLDGSIHNETFNGLQKYRGLMLQVNPYPDENGDHTCIVVRHRELNTKPHRTIGDKTRNFLSAALGSLPTSYAISKMILKLYPSKAPDLIETSLKMLKDKRYENKGYKVLYQGVELIKLKAYDAEFAFDMNGEVPFVKVVESLFERAKQIAEEKGYYQSAPIGLRFVGRSEAYLAPEYGKEVCYIDTPVLLDTKGADYILGEYQKVMFEQGGIPHWGKVNDILEANKEQLKELYPKLDVWESVFREMNPDGIFTNEYIERLNLGYLTEGTSFLRKAA